MATAGSGDARRTSLHAATPGGGDAVLGSECSHRPRQRAAIDTVAHGCVGDALAAAFDAVEQVRNTAEIDAAVAHDTVFHQFMLYTPMPGTALQAQVAREVASCRTWTSPTSTASSSSTSCTPRFLGDESKTLLDRAVALDYERNGPSLYRLMRTIHQRWLRYRSDPDPRVRERVCVGATRLRWGYGAALWAMERYLRPPMSGRIRELRSATEREFGAAAVALNRTIGPLLLWASRRSSRRYPNGQRREPQTFVEHHRPLA